MSGANFCVIRGEKLRLLHQRAVYWAARETLLISDLHLGKSHHFSKGGIPLPKSIDTNNLLQLKSLLEVLQPQRVIFLGDLFHSDHNDHVHEVKALLERFPEVEKVLVAGNHDIMEESDYRALGLKCHANTLCDGPFVMSHEPLSEEERGGLYNLYGHIHPGVRMRGKARQSVVLPCFHFGPNEGVFPAFGNMTGLYPIRTKKGDKVFAIVHRSIIDCSPVTT